VDLLAKTVSLSIDGVAIAGFQNRDKIGDMLRDAQGGPPLDVRPPSAAVSRYVTLFNQREWDAEITEQHPDHRVAWKALNQEGPNGVVTFHKLDDSHTKVMVQMEYEPEGMKESLGSVVGFDSHRVKGDLESFKEFIESRGSESGAG